MTTKTEERIKILIKECLDEKRDKLTKDVSDNVVAIFLWGFIAGIAFAYTSLAPMTIGIIIGICITKKYTNLVNYFVMRIGSFMNTYKNIIKFEN